MDDFDFRNYNQSVSKISVLLLNADVFTCYFASIDFAGAGKSMISLKVVCLSW